MKKNKLCYFLLLIVLLLITSSCKKHTHNWLDATCTTPKTCSICNMTEGKALGHLYDFECSENCKRCNMPREDEAPHDWLDATCTTPMICQKCHKTEGEALGHEWLDATYDAPRTCIYCGTTEGEPLEKPTITLRNYREYISIGSQTKISVVDYSIDEFDIVIENEDILSIDEFGNVTGLNYGKSQITLTYKYDKILTKTIEIEVIGVQPSAYTNYQKMELNNVAYIYLENLEELIETSLDDFKISFQIGNILELQNDKTLKAIGYGTETVTLTSILDERITTSFEITVVDASSTIVIHSTNDNGFYQIGDQFKMQIANNLYQNNEVLWSSSAQSVATVTDEGIVNIVGEGNVLISAYLKVKPNEDNKIASYYLTVKGVANIDYISRFIHIALEQNGIKEEGENLQKFGEWYGNNGQPWCAMFVSWCWHMAGLSEDILLKYQGCSAGLAWCTEKGIMHYVQDYRIDGTLYQATSYKPVTGDIVFFLSSGMSHTGIVIYSDDTYLYTIEGNTSDQVAIKRWSLNDARITGYAHPEYPSYEGTPEDFSWIAKEKDDGSVWWTNVSEKQKVD